MAPSAISNASTPKMTGLAMRARLGFRGADLFTTYGERDVTPFGATAGRDGTACLAGSVAVAVVDGVLAAANSGFNSGTAADCGDAATDGFAPLPFTGASASIFGVRSSISCFSSLS